MMKDRATSAVLASFAGDALSLGAHWIYSAEMIARDFGRVEFYSDPAPDSYHPTKKKGEFTHYGDQVLVLLESLSAVGAFDPQDFSRRWQELFTGYHGYYDQATRETLKNFAGGKPFPEAGAVSNDLSGAVRIAPLAYAFREDEEKLVSAARTQTGMTHRDGLTVDASEFFARVVFRVMHGRKPVQACEEVADRYFPGSSILQHVKKGVARCSSETVTTIGELGQDCHLPSAFPSVVHTICRYENDLKEALIQTVMAGGDSAARGLAVGMVLGAHLGMEAIPREWIEGLKKRTEIMALLGRL